MPIDLKYDSQLETIWHRGDFPSKWVNEVSIANFEDKVNDLTSLVRSLACGNVQQVKKFVAYARYTYNLDGEIIRTYVMVTYFNKAIKVASYTPMDFSPNIIIKQDNPLPSVVLCFCYHCKSGVCPL
jgi:hypothetical protein